MNKLFIFITILGAMLCMIPSSIFGENIEMYYKFQPIEDCRTLSKIDPNTSVTFYGDSRGDFVDLSPVPFKDIPAIEDGGFLGWPAYLGAGSGAVPGTPAVWNVQNQAVGGWTTVDLYKAIVRCSNANNFAVYKTATRYAVEIGANDAVRNSLYALFMPWIFPKIQQRIQTNQTAVVELLKAALSGRGITNLGDNILFMETLPVISRGPVHGTPEEQCFSWWNFCNIMTPGEANTYEMVLAIAKGRGNLNKDQYEQLKELKRKLAINTLGFLASKMSGHPDLYSAEANQKLVDVMMQIADSWERIAGPKVGEALREVARDYASPLGLHTDEYDTPLGKKKYKGDDPIVKAYLNWLGYFTPGYSWDTIISMIIYSNRDAEKQMAADTGVHYLELWGYFIHPEDCALGACYVANGDLYGDFWHFNYRGYAMWGFHTGYWMKQHNWDLPDTDPTHKQALTVAVTAPDPGPVEVTPDPIDWTLVLWLWWKIICGC